MTDNGDPAVRVTLPVIYDKLLDVERKVDPIPSIVADHEARLRVVEISQAKGTPRAPWWTVVAVLGVAASLAVSIVALFVH